MKKLLVILTIMFLVSSCVTKKEEIKEVDKDLPKIETNSWEVEKKVEEVEDKKVQKASKWLEFTLISDKTEVLSKELKVIEQISTQIKSDSILKDAKFTSIDFFDEEAKKILKENNITQIPVLLVNNDVWIEWEVPEKIKKLKDWLFIVREGFYNPETKKYSQEMWSLCSNKIDDDGNGKTDCEESSCLQLNPNNICEKELKQKREKSNQKIKDAKIQIEREQEVKLEKIKSEKPNVDLYVMSYCPYGTQAQKPFISIMKKFDEITNIDIKYVPYVMHNSQGEGEENLLQHCIKTTQKEKFVSYLSCFLKDWNSKECLEETWIDETKLETCVKETDEKFEITKNLADKSKKFPDFNINKDSALKAWVKSSPTLVVNWLRVVVTNRTEKGFAKIICSTFKTTPEICKDISKFSDKKYNPWFGFEEPNYAGTDEEAPAWCAAY